MATTPDPFKEESRDQVNPISLDTNSAGPPREPTDLPKDEPIFDHRCVTPARIEFPSEDLIGTPKSSSDLFVSEDEPEEEPNEPEPEPPAALPQEAAHRAVEAVDPTELMLLKQRRNLARAQQTRKNPPQPVPAFLPAPLDTRHESFEKVKEMYVEKKWNGTLTEAEERDFAIREQMEIETTKRARIEAEGDELQAPKPRKRAKLGSDKKSKAGSRKKKSSGVDRDSGPTTIQKLFSNNVFRDAAATAHLGSQPVFGAHKQRSGVWKEILATLPEKDRPSAKEDQMELDRAIAYINGNENGSGRQSVKPASDGSGLWKLKGICTPLKAYQVMGVSFMRKRENSKEEPRGGLLCDAMGLGKTLQCLANILNGRPKPDAKVKATLVIASPALVAQWRAEIDVHCEKIENGYPWGVGRIMSYHARNRIDSSDMLDVLGNATIVLTTYHEVSRNYPKAIYPTELVTAQEKDEWWRKHFEATRGPLHRIKWHRICLDEAAYIKNHKSHISNACRALMYDHAWAITGTPVMNNLGEFYSLLKLVRCPHTTTHRLFKENYDSDMDVDGIRKLCYFLDEVMIRRTHADTMFNARLLDLPPPEEKTVWIEFSPLERKIYSIVQERMIEKINTIAAHENVDTEKSNSHVWTLLLRLRQMCSHVLLIQDTIDDVLDRSDYERLNALSRRKDGVDKNGRVLLEHLADVMNKSADKQAANAGEERAVAEASKQQHQESGSTYEYEMSMQRLARIDRAIEDKRHARCVYCDRIPQNAFITNCDHIYCEACLEALQHDAARRGHTEAPCFKCNEPYASAQPLQEKLHDEQAQAEAEGVIERLRKGQANRQRAQGIKHWISTLRGEVLCTAKAKAAKKQIAAWLREDTSCKMIVYTQFLDIIRIMGRICDDEGWEYVRYTGEMSHEARGKAIERFAAEPATRVFLASLKCGGIGLNLTMASRVLNLDPWFNLAVENQAFCRVFRIGQEKPTRMTRLVVQDSIDSAMHALKERKQVEIDAVMDTQGRTRLSVRELMELLGQVKETKKGKPFIVSGGVVKRAPVRE